MKNVKFLLSAACVLFAVAAMAQQDFSDPKYAVWGDTPQEREQNILNSNFLKESLDNKDYNAAAHYLKELLDKCPKASQNTFVRGITLYKNKIARAKSIAEKNTYTDSLMIVYDLRNEYFGDHPKYGTPYILDRKAIFLGKKTDGAPFTEQELNLLSILINQATFAIEHASLYEQQTERLKKMYRTDRLATLGELAAGAAHEIRNPLTAIRSTIQYLSKDFSADPVKSEMVTELISEVERINKIVQGLLSFARPSDLNTSDINIEQLINQTLLLVTNTLRKQNVEVEFEYFTDNTTIQGDAEQLKQVFLNIILNAVEAMGKNPPERSRTLIISIEKGTPINTHSRYLIISFEDSGKGIEQKNIENVFNPFFTTKEEGTGLGLAICYGIINRHEGEIEVKSVPDKGTCINIKLPQRI